MPWYTTEHARRDAQRQAKERNMVALLSVRRGQDLVFQRLLGSGHDEKFRVEARDGCTVIVIAGSFEPLLVQNGDSVTISFVMT